VFDAECWALKQAAEHLVRKDTTNKKIVIGVDSQAAILRMQTRHIGAAQATACDFGNAVQTLQAKGNQLMVLWTPSHIGIQGNEKADVMAEKAA
ncbi:hypothetical protein EDC01DRAFT_596530, partial [Geopyxis carbonaria]